MPASAAQDASCPLRSRATSPARSAQHRLRPTCSAGSAPAERGARAAPRHNLPRESAAPRNKMLTVLRPAARRRRPFLRTRATQRRRRAQRP